MKNLVKNQGTAFNDKISKIISSIKKSVVDAQPTADTGKLIVIKKVVCINWPEKEFGPCPFLPEHFIIVVTGNRDFPSRFRGSATGTEVILVLGPYKVSDVGPLHVVRDITPSFSGDCRQIGQLSSAQGAIRNAGETQTCTIFNTLRFS